MLWSTTAFHAASQRVPVFHTHVEVGSNAHATVVLGLDMCMRRFRSMGVATTIASAGTAFIVLARSSTCMTDIAYKASPYTRGRPRMMHHVLWPDWHNNRAQHARSVIPWEGVPHYGEEASHSLQKCGASK